MSTVAFEKVRLPVSDQKRITVANSPSHTVRACKHRLATLRNADTVLLHRPCTVEEALGSLEEDRKTVARDGLKSYSPVLRIKTVMLWINSVRFRF